MRTVIPFSGGVDSTYVAWKALTQGTDDITLLMARAEQKSNMASFRGGKEMRTAKGAESALAVARYLQRSFRKLKIEQFEIDLSEETNVDVPGAGQLSVVQAARMCNAGKADKVLATYERDNDGTIWGPCKDLVWRTSALLARDNFKRIATRGRIEFPLIEMGYSQAHAMRDFTPELYALTFSCDRAKNGGPCGECYKCAKRKFLSQKIKEGLGPDEIAAFCKAKSTTPKGWIPMKIWLKEFVPEFHPLWDMETPPYLKMPEYPEAYGAS